MSSSETKLDTEHNACRLGDWYVEPSLNVLRRDGQTVTIEPRLMKLLMTLVAHRGEVVAKDVLLDSVWIGLSATDESLSQAIFHLRKTLGDDSERPLYIETIRKRGYRLVAEVTSLDQPVLSGSRRAVWVVLAAVILAMAVFITKCAQQAPVSTVSALDPRPISSSAGRERDPDISSDGLYVVYSALDEVGASQIFLHGIGSGAQDRQLTYRNENGAPMFFDDNKRVAFLRRDGERCTVMSVTLVDGAERVLGDCSGNGYRDIAVSPDDRFIAFNARDDIAQPHAIRLLDLQKQTSHTVTAPPVGVWGDYDPTFSSDSRYLFFARSVSEGMQDVFRLDLMSDEETQLTNDGRNIFGLAAQDDRVYFGTNRDGSYGIWSMQFDGSDQGRLPISASGLVNPAIAENAVRLVYEKVERSVDLTGIDLDGSGEPRPLLSFNADILHPNVSQKTGRIAFSSNRSGHYEIWDVDANGGDLRQLTRFESGFTAHPAFSPDGRFIAFDARPSGVAQLFVMAADGSEQQALTAADRNAYSPSWSDDGNALLLSMETSAGLEIHRLDMASSTIEQVTTDGGAYAIEKANGELLYVRPGHDGIWRWTPESEDAPAHLLSKPEAADWGSWALHDNRITYYDREAGSVLQYDLKSGETTLVTELTDELPTSDPALAVGADGTRVYVSIRRRLDSDLGMVELP